MTISQDNLFDYQKAIELRDKGVASAEKNADPQWKEFAWNGVLSLAKTGKPFTSDDIWAYLEGLATTPEPKALGAVFLRAAKRKLIKPTGEFWQSKRPQAHGRRLMVWTGVEA
jgi:hypothetical protein